MSDFLTMPHSITVMLPTFPINNGGITYLKGHLSVSGNGKINLYIIHFSSNADVIEESSSEENILYGCCGKDEGASPIFHRKNHIVFDNYLHIRSLSLGGVPIEETINIVILLYDYNLIKHSEAIPSSECYFSELSNFIQDKGKHTADSVIFRPCFKTPFWLTYSTFAQHCLSYFNLANWLIGTIRKERKVSIKSGNLILAIMTDVILGYLFLELFVIQQKDLSSTLMGTLEKLVNLLYTLLKWLMGAPAGLKLNKAFNNMLGKYFSYHIQLWWLFLDVSRFRLDSILHIYKVVGYLGFTFQAAIISDMIYVATFHSYCIYVYAARLFNIQISGLIALLRLFVGRKYNPLRGGIDSCEYTNQELFVGTVAFTILLLLLPTTAMYYIVFTLFRLMSLVVQYTLAKLINLIQTLPLYVVALWAAQSPKVAGKLLIEVESNEECSPLILRAKLLRKPLQELISKYEPPVEAPNHFDWTNFISNLLVGNQLG